MKKKGFKELISNLPKTPGVMGRDRLFNCAVLIPFVKIDNEFYILFQKRAENIKQGGDICFPGGAFEEGIDKNFKDTALRETNEELGIKIKDIKIIGQLDSMITSFGVIVESFVGKLKKSSLENMKIDKAEVDSTILIPLDYFKNNKPEIYYLRNEVKPYHIDELGNKEIYFPVEELGLPKTYQKPWGHKKHKIYVYKYKEHVIWGMTAVILNDLLKRY